MKMIIFNEWCDQVESKVFSFLNSGRTFVMVGILIYHFSPGLEKKEAKEAARRAGRTDTPKAVSGAKIRQESTDPALRDSNNLNSIDAIGIAQPRRTLNLNEAGSKVEAVSKVDAAKKAAAKKAVEAITKKVKNANGNANNTSDATSSTVRTNANGDVIPPQRQIGNNAKKVKGGGRGEWVYAPKAGAGEDSPNKDSAQPPAPKPVSETPNPEKTKSRRSRRKSAQQAAQQGEESAEVR